MLLKQTPSYFSSDLVDEVIDKCRALIERSPNEPKHWRNLGNAYFKKEHYAEALKAYEKVLEITPQDTSLQLAAGRCFELLDNLEGAETLFRRAYLDKPDWPDTSFWLGKILFARGNLDEARSLLIAAIAKNPAFKDAMYNLSLLYEKEGNLQEALNVMKRIVAIPPGTWKSKNPFPYDLDILFDDPVLLDEVIIQLESFLKGREGFADVHFKLGMAYRKKGDRQKAALCFQAAIKISPKFHLARHYYWNEDTEESR